MSTAELACTYAALLLHDDGQEVTAEKLQSVLKAAGVSVEPYWPGLFAKTLAGKKIDDLITNIGSGAQPRSSQTLAARPAGRRRAARACRTPRARCAAGHDRSRAAGLASGRRRPAGAVQRLAPGCLRFRVVQITRLQPRCAAPVARTAAPRLGADAYAPAPSRRRLRRCPRGRCGARGCRRCRARRWWQEEGGAEGGGGGGDGHVALRLSTSSAALAVAKRGAGRVMHATRAALRLISRSSVPARMRLSPHALASTSQPHFFSSALKRTGANTLQHDPAARQAVFATQTSREASAPAACQHSRAPIARAVQSSAMRAPIWAAARTSPLEARTARPGGSQSRTPARCPASRSRAHPAGWAAPTRRRACAQSCPPPQPAAPW